MNIRKMWGIALILAGVVLGAVALAGIVGRGGSGIGERSAPSAPASPTSAATATPSPSASPSPAPSPSIEPAETPERFFARLSAALRSGRPAFPFARLHPFVFDRYLRADCRAYFGGLEVPGYDVEVLRTGETGSFRWETDGLRRTIPSATTVRIRVTEDGDTFTETDTHLVLRGGRYLFLSDCGTPKEAAR